jgi:hypothetical protein
MGDIRDSFTLLPPTPTGSPLGSPAEVRSIAIHSIAPNPVRSGARIEYEVPDRGPVRLSLYDAAGRLVRRIVDEEVPAGVHRARWDGRDRYGHPVAAGVYFAKLRTSRGRTESVKMVVLR